MGGEIEFPDRERLPTDVMRVDGDTRFGFFGSNSCEFWLATAKLRCTIFETNNAEVQGSNWKYLSKSTAARENRSRAARWT
jgi:hypothetical protein